VFISFMSQFNFHANAVSLSTTAVHQAIPETH
jgi:hypothetical protein